MTDQDYDYRATIDTDAGTFTFEGDRPQAVSAQVARIPVLLHEKQIKRRVDLECSIYEYMRAQAEEEKKQKERAERRRRHRTGDRELPDHD